jgi:hypothetical protein
MSGVFYRLGTRGAKPNPDAFWSDKWGWLDEVDGAEKRWCVKHDCEGLGNADRDEVGCTGAGVGRRVDMDCKLIPVLIIPVSDGGSET